MDVSALAQTVVESVKNYIEKYNSEVKTQIAGIRTEIDAVDQKIKSEITHHLAQIPVIEPQKGDPGEKGQDGQDGDSVTVDDVLPHIDKTLSDHLSTIQKQVDDILAQVPTEPPKQGEKGEDGASVTLDDVLPIIDKTLSDHLSTIQKQVDDILSQIPTEPPKQGEKGEDGASVTLDDVLPIIDKEIRERMALVKDGKDGKDGKDARDGRDALDINILPTLDPDWVYPRGTYAKYKGGLWKSFSDTDGMKGWDCIVKGIDSFDIEHDGEREFKLVSLSSTGERLEKAFNVPMMIYKEVYKQGDHYVKGDAVTWGGSLWVALAATDEKPGSGSKAWKLSVKAGRDANAPVKVKHA